MFPLISVLREYETEELYQYAFKFVTNAALEKGGYAKMMWCGDEECEDKVKEETGVGSRCIPFNQETVADTCICCGKPAKHLVYWGKAY